jgi:hypothetical protein
MTKVEETISKMNEFLKPFENGLREKDIIYRNEKTGLVVIDGTHTGTFYAADPDGFAMSAYFCYYEASIDAGEVRETDEDEKVVVSVNGSITSYWEIVCPARDIIFKKSDFTPWGEKVEDLVHFY